ncbi:MAG: hypothetical protein IPF48_00455 [Sphingomonadales bacterium]|nr:hypothetical protein [Sphingomonadales bacterium]
MAPMATTVQFNSLLRFILATLVSSALPGCDTKPIPIMLEKYCVSESGMSKYWLSLNTSERQGTINYQYMGQDIRYAVKAMQLDGHSISGIAHFQSSSTGEIRAIPFKFVFAFGNNVLTDGKTTALCQNDENA